MLKPITTYLLFALALLTSLSSQASNLNVASEDAIFVEQDLTFVSPPRLSTPRVAMLNVTSKPWREHLPEIFEAEEEEDNETSLEDVDQLHPVLTSNFSLLALLRFFGQQDPPVIERKVITKLTSLERLVRLQVFLI